MKTVFKYAVPIDDQPHEVPGRVVHVEPNHMAHEVIVWAEVMRLPDSNGTLCVIDAAQPYQVYGTGHDIPSSSEYKGSVLSGPFVWHLYLLESE